MINRKLWQLRFMKFPSWPCPSCHSGTLTLKEETFVNLETGASEKSQDHEAWEPDWIDERFVGLLVCQDAACGEIVAIGGRTHIETISIMTSKNKAGSVCTSQDLCVLRRLSSRSRESAPDPLRMN
jgi:hypothetical protein